MRSHATKTGRGNVAPVTMFQYRKRYEVTCDDLDADVEWADVVFQYRKRYEVTCDVALLVVLQIVLEFQYRKRYEVTCDHTALIENFIQHVGFNTASGMRSHATVLSVFCSSFDSDVSIPQAV